MWSDAIRVTIQNYSRRHINVLISMGGIGLSGSFQDFMGIWRWQKEKNLGHF